MKLRRMRLFTPCIVTTIGRSQFTLPGTRQRKSSSNTQRGGALLHRFGLRRIQSGAAQSELRQIIMRFTYPPGLSTMTLPSYDPPHVYCGVGQK